MEKGRKPKGKETVVKANVARPSISQSSLFLTPTNVFEGFEERLQTGIDWTLVERARRHHHKICSEQEIPTIPFSEALKNKIAKSILAGFLDEESSISLEQQWEFILPITQWDVEKFSNEEGQICFKNANCITDDMVKLIKKAVMVKDRAVLRNDLKKVNVLRVTDSQMTDLDNEITTFENLVSLNLCGNYIENLDSNLLCRNLRSLELQANRVKSIAGFVDALPPSLLYLGLARNMFKDGIELDYFGRLPHHITVLDLSDNDIYDLESVLNPLTMLPNLTSLQLAGNPCSVCSHFTLFTTLRIDGAICLIHAAYIPFLTDVKKEEVCAAYARTVLTRLPLLMWLDYREIIPTDRPINLFEPHPDDLRSAQFFFTVIRVISAAQPPKPEKGSTALFHIELDIPLLDSLRRRFLMYRRNESLIEMLPPPEDYWPSENNISVIASNPQNNEQIGEQSVHESDIYKMLEEKNSRLIQNYTTFQSNKVPWSKIMNFTDPTIKIFCPDLVALRDTFRTVVTVKLVYTLSTVKASKDKKNTTGKPVRDQRVVLASIKCALKNPDWSQSSQHFHWDDSLKTDEAIHWGDGDLSILQYVQGTAKPVKSRSDGEAAIKQEIPDNLTCQFGFGIETMK